MGEENHAPEEGTQLTSDLTEETCSQGKILSKV